MSQKKYFKNREMQKFLWSEVLIPRERGGTSGAGRVDDSPRVKKILGKSIALILFWDFGVIYITYLLYFTYLLIYFLTYIVAFAPSSPKISPNDVE